MKMTDESESHGRLRTLIHDYLELIS
jgi:hypothetical protein